MWGFRSLRMRLQIRKLTPWESSCHFPNWRMLKTITYNKYYFCLDTANYCSAKDEVKRDETIFWLPQKKIDSLQSTTSQPGILSWGQWLYKYFICCKSLWGRRFWRLELWCRECFRVLIYLTTHHTVFWNENCKKDLDYEIKFSYEKIHFILSLR